MVAPFQSWPFRPKRNEQSKKLYQTASGEDGPICLWARDGEKYYFANQIAGHEELVKWLAKAK